MKKWANVASYVLIIVLAAVLYLQYQSDMGLKNTLGSTYKANIPNMLMHLRHIETYLSSEKEFKANDLLSYYYEANYLLNIRLPDEHFVPPYIQTIQSGFYVMQDLVSKGASAEDIQKEKYNALKALGTLKGAMEVLDKAGSKKVKDGFQEDYVKYYELSLAGNKTMAAVNRNLENGIKERLH